MNMETITIIKKRIRSARAPLALLRQRTVPPILGKYFILAVLLCRCVSTSAQKSASVADIKTFYQKVDIECCRTLFQNGMDDFDRWLVDTLYKKTSVGIRFRPAEINLSECSLEYFVPLRFFDMESFSEGDDIYEHIVIDSTLCVSLIPIDKHDRPIGVTDYDSQPYSFFSFQKEKRWFYQDSHVRSKYVRKFLKYARKYDSEAHVQVALGTSKFYGFIRNGKIFLVTKKKRPIELSAIVRQIISFDGLDARLFRHSDRLYIPIYRKKWDDNYDGRPKFRRVGFTPDNEKRMCTCGGSVGSGGRFY